MVRVNSSWKLKDRRFKKKKQAKDRSKWIRKEKEKRCPCGCGQLLLERKQRNIKWPVQGVY